MDRTKWFVSKSFKCDTHQLLQSEWRQTEQNEWNCMEIVFFSVAFTCIHTAFPVNPSGTASSPSFSLVSLRHLFSSASSTDGTWMNWCFFCFSSIFIGDTQLSDTCIKSTRSFSYTLVTFEYNSIGYAPLFLFFPPFSFLLAQNQ